MYTWDYTGRLASAPGTSFTYDYLGRRTTSTSGNTTTRYISFEQHTVSERNTTLGVSTDYDFGPGIDEPLAKRTADGTISYYGVDGLGSVVLVTDANATVTGSAAYDAWGNRGGGTELFGYTSRETGGPFWFYRARYYDAGTGRFISEDPLGFLTGPNLYAYVRNVPTILKDPFGLGDLVRFPGNRKPEPEFPNCFDRPDVRDMKDPDYNFRNTPRFSPPVSAAARFAVTVALAAVNIAAWNCVVAQSYCASQDDYCDCMRYANPSGYCKD